MNILIAGCRGFIGSAVGNLAAARGHDVMGLGRSSNPSCDWGGAYLQSDVVTSNLSDTISDFQPEVIVHAVGSASVSNSYSATIADFRVSALSWLNMLESVRHSHCNPLVILLGSAAVYSPTNALPLKETSVVQPISPYGFHKAECELISQEYSKCFGLRTLTCRLFSVFGPKQRRLLVWDLYRSARNDAEIVLKGTGKESRDYLHVDDVADALIQLALKLGQTDCLNDTLNVASGFETSVSELAQTIGSLVAPHKEVVAKGEVQKGNPQNWCADVTRLKTLLPEWRPLAFSERLVDCIRQWQQEETH